MTKFESDYAGITDYLLLYGIDASRIPEDGFDETGYDYWPFIPNGAVPVDKFEVERRAWPNPGVYKGLVERMGAWR